MSLMEETVNNIKSLDYEAMEKAEERLDNLIKPPRSLGVLEEIAIKISGIYGSSKPVIGEKSVILMAGDHGVVEEGVSAAPKEVTIQMLPNFIKGVAGIGVLSKQAGAKLVVVDIGTDGDVDIPGITSKKVRKGTRNIAREAAMSRDEAIEAIEVGIEIARNEVKNGASILATGDMGIGNTTPSSAILAVISGLSAKEVTGRGTLVNDEVLIKKEKAVASSLKVNNPDPNDGIDVLSKVGGLEIGGLVGVILGGASCNIPVLIDGFISTAAALIATVIEPKVKDYLIPSHLSEETGHRLMLEYMGMKPMLHMDMRLGEGTGAVLAFNLVDAACRILNEMATFKEAEVMDLNGELLLNN